jgi:hypothetical protein
VCGYQVEGRCLRVLGHGHVGIGRSVRCEGGVRGGRSSHNHHPVPLLLRSRGIIYRADEKSALAGPNLNSRVAGQTRIALPNPPVFNGADLTRGPVVSFPRAN